LRPNLGQRTLDLGNGFRYLGVDSPRIFPQLTTLGHKGSSLLKGGLYFAFLLVYLKEQLHE
jgi:hypothetical protein